MHNPKDSQDLSRKLIPISGKSSSERMSDQENKWYESESFKSVIAIIGILLGIWTVVFFTIDRSEGRMEKKIENIESNLNQKIADTNTAIKESEKRIVDKIEEYNKDGREIRKYLFQHSMNHGRKDSL